MAMTIKITELETLVTNAIRTQYSAEEAELMKEVVMFGELAGKPSHGLLRLFKENYGVFTDTITGIPEYIHKTKVSTIIEAHGNPGMLIGPLATKEVIRLAKETGVGIVGTKGSINSTGSLSYYCEKIAKENLIGVIMTHASPMTVAFSSKKALFGTNPLAFGIPSIPHPIIFDMATSAITFGAIAKYKAAGKKLPENLAVDKEGKSTTDPTAAMEGATLAFDNSYKGSGLAMIVELLGGLWTGASFAGNNKKDLWGNLYMAFSPELLQDLGTFKEKTQKFIATLQAAETRDGQPIRIPGESTLAIRDANIKRGEIELEEALIARIRQIT